MADGNAISYKSAFPITLSAVGLLILLVAGWVKSDLDYTNARLDSLELTVHDNAGKVMENSDIIKVLQAEHEADAARLNAVEKAIQPLPGLAHQVDIDHEFFLNHLDADKAIDILRGRRRK